METITPEQREKLHKAIDLAQGNGMCRYVVDDQPHCVAAQFLSLCGVTTDELRGLGNRIIWLSPVAMSENETAAFRVVDAKLGMDRNGILSKLQDEWDCANHLQTTDQVRARMHQMVDEGTKLA